MVDVHDSGKCASRSARPTWSTWTAGECGREWTARQTAIFFHLNYKLFKGNQVPLGHQGLQVARDLPAFPGSPVSQDQKELQANEWGNVLFLNSILQDQKGEKELAVSFAEQFLFFHCFTQSDHCPPPRTAPGY